MAMSTQRASSSLLSAESAPRWKHDVFLSFRGADTRVGFISHLYHELQYWQAIRTFKDDKELEVGASISPELLSAIEQSHLAIVVLSPNYASSGWCLDELAKIFESMETRDNTILPVFFHVDPCDVRYQRGSFAQAFAKHEERYSKDMDKLNKWRAALRKVASLSGWDSKNYESERELIKVIVKCVWSKVRPTITLSHSTDKLVGIDFGLGELGILLAPEANDVRFIGIWGMGGIGKTTLAKLVFERISHHFEVSKFLLNVREVSSKLGTLVNLQKQLLSPILRENTAQVWDEQEGTFFIRTCLFNKKVLLIVDDVDHYRQLEILVGNKSWFGNGSRIIITTRDKRILIQHDIERSYKVEGLDPNKSLELFSQNAFRKDKPEEDFLQMSECFVDYAKGLPLALKVLGRALYKRDLGAWTSILDKLKKIPNPTIFDTLKLSYDALEEMERSIFLDVAFFYMGIEKERLIEILEICDFSGRIGLDILIENEKSLLTIGSYSHVEMHDLIKEMAWEIVRQESIKEPGLRSRLCHRKDIFHVFTENTGTESIRGIRLRLPRLEEAGSSWNCENFSKMLKLTVLEFNNLKISSGPNFLPNSLRILKWDWYPSKFLPASFRPNLLTELIMMDSKLVQLWDGKLDLPHLTYMDLSRSNLTKTPDVSGITNLRELDLINCTDLVDIHPSIAVHKKLTGLRLGGCESIESFPSEIEMDSLQLLGLRGCSKLRNIPEFGVHMKNLFSLELGGTVIEKLPSSMEHLVGLQFLDMTGCSKLEKLPELLGKMDSLQEILISETAAIREPPPFLFLMEHLKKLHFDGKSSMTRKRDLGFWGLFGSKSPKPWGFVLPSLRALRSLESLNLTDHGLSEGAIPDDIGYCMSSLRFLNLSGNNFVSLPATIKFLSKLERFHVDRCQRLQRLPALPSNHLLHVITDDCASLKLLSEPSKLLNPSSTSFSEFIFSSVNCYGLVDDEGWNNGILSIIRRLANQGIPPVFEKFNIVSPGSQIPEWFSNQIEGDSLVVQIPPNSCSKWMGIAFCVVTADLGNPAPLGCEFLEMRCFWDGNCCNYWGFKVTGHLVRAHLWIFYMSREDILHSFTYYNYSKRWLTNTVDVVFSFQTSYRSFGNEKMLNIKKCGARLVCQQDLEELLHGTVNKLERTRKYSDEAGPSGNGGSNEESLFKRLKGRLFS